MSLSKSKVEAPYRDRHVRPLVGVVLHPADIQDRDGAEIVIQATHNLFPWLRRCAICLRTRSRRLQPGRDVGKIW
jgi:hypothetical protein